MEIDINFYQKVAKNTLKMKIKANYKVKCKYGLHD